MERGREREVCEREAEHVSCTNEKGGGRQRIQNALKFESESMPICDRRPWRRTLVRGNEVDGGSVGALEHLVLFDAPAFRPHSKFQSTLKNWLAPAASGGRGGHGGGRWRPFEAGCCANP